MMKRICGLAAPLAMLLATAPAAAVVSYTSLLEYKDAGGSSPTKAGPFGKILIEELDPFDVKITVTLLAPEVGFLNTGGPHDPFLFNLSGNYPVTVTNGPGQTFVNGGYNTTGTFQATPFGSFTNMIACCDNKNGASHMSPPPLTFTVHDSNGITFAGLGATYDPTTGKLLTLGTGDHFLSNSGGWWFAADLVDSNGKTFNVAAKDAFRTLVQQSAVPEPASWALMIVGFGAIGMGLRRQRAHRANSLA